MTPNAFIAATDQHVVARIIGEGFNRLLNTIPVGDSFLALDVDLMGAREGMTVDFEEVDRSNPLHGVTFSIEKIGEDERGTSRVTLRSELAGVTELSAGTETAQPEAS